MLKFKGVRFFVSRNNSSLVLGFGHPDILQNKTGILFKYFIHFTTINEYFKPNKSTGGSHKKGEKAFFSILLFYRANGNFILVAFHVSDECSSTLPIGVPMGARGWP